MLETKLNRPKLFNDLLIRSHLIEKLERGSRLPFILISAPAGYGKSILLSQWLEQQKNNYGWLSLDESMRDSTAFLSYFAKVLKRASSAEMPDLNNLDQEYNFFTWEKIIDLIINEINELNEPIRLILDDYHLIHNQEIHQLMSALINENISHFQLIIITRHDPPLQLRKLRLYQKMLEIRAQDLRFSENETHALLEIKPSIKLNKDEIIELTHRTEGWILGIRVILMARSLNEEGDEKVSFDYFTNDLDLLIDHIGDNFSPEFIRRVQLCALCNHFNRELVEFIFSFSYNESGSAESFLSELSDLNLFLVPTIHEGGSWYRFHHLFAAILSRRLKSNEPDIIKPLYTHISSWFEDKGLIDEAINYAIKAQNNDLACSLITKYRVSQLDLGEWWVVQHWLERIPEQIRKSKVDLLLAELRIFEDTWKLEDISSILSTLKSMGIENSDSKTRSYYLFHLGFHFTFARTDAKKAIECFEQSKNLHKNETMFGSRREVILAIARQMLGKSSLALTSLDDIEKNFSPSSLMHIRSLHSRVFVHLLSGNMPDAAVASEKFYFASRNCGYKTVEAFSWYFRGNIAFQSFNEDVAEQAFCSTLGFNGMLNYRMYFDAMAGLILFNSLKGDEKVTESIFQEMKKKIATLKDPKFQIYLRSLKARVNWHIGQGDKDLAWAQTDWTKQIPASYFCLIDVPDLTKIRIMVSHGSILEVEEALRVLAEVEAFLDSLHNQYHTIDIELLKAMALWRVNRSEHASESLNKALLMAEKRDTIRSIIEAYRVMPSLFYLADQSDITRRVLARIGLKSSNIKSLSKSIPKTEELSIREQEIVQLIAKGLRNKEIAHQLHISTVTVKSHLTNIYRKLEVANRTSMLQKVRNLDILS